MQPGAALYGQLLSRGEAGIVEVGLEKTRTSKAYRAKLEVALAQLLLWVATTSWAAIDWMSDATKCNQVLCEYVEKLHRGSGKLVSARNAILSVQAVRRELRGKLGRCWDCIKAWQLETPLKSRVPMPEDLVRAFFAFAIAEGLAATKDREVLTHFAFALLIRVGFECLLRPGELLKLKVKDLRLPRSRYEPPVCVVTLRDAKNKSSLGRFQFAMITDPSLVSWLAWFTADCPGELHLWPGSSGKFSRHFNRVLLRLGLGRLPLTPGCLRPGGATRLFLAGKTISSLKYAGRWRAETSLEVYVQEAMCHLASTEMSDAEFEGVQQLLQVSLKQWSGPPSGAWSSLFSRGAQWHPKAIAKMTAPPIAFVSSKA